MCMYVRTYYCYYSVLVLVEEIGGRLAEVRTCHSSIDDVYDTGHGDIRINIMKRLCKG